MSDDVKAIMVKVAQAIATRAQASNEPPFAEQIDALKALTAMYTALRKHPDDSGDDAGDGFDFSKGVQADADEDLPDERTTVTPIRTRRRPG